MRVSASTSTADGGAATGSAADAGAADAGGAPGLRLLVRTLPAPTALQRAELTASTEEELPAEGVRSALDTPAMFDALFGGSPFAAWLDTALVVPGRARFSVMGAPDGPLGEIVTADAAAGTVTVRPGGGARERSGETRVLHEDALTYLEREHSRRRIDTSALSASHPDLPADVCLGYLGYLGYEAIGIDDDVPARHRPATPDAVWLFTDRAAVIDHVTGDIHLMSLVDESTNRDPVDRHPNATWLDTAEQALAAAGPSLRPVVPTSWMQPPVTPRHDATTYQDLVRECQRQIFEGESYEICLTNEFVVEADVDPWSTYVRLRERNPAPHASFLRLGPELAVLSSSPERFLQVSGTGVVEAKPIKGTRPRGATPAEDAAIKAELASNEKDRAENIMIVDLMRNDLQRSCDVGSVHVPVLLGVESYASVHQLVTTVRGQLRDDVSAAEAVRRAFPGGSMTGAPKRRTMEIIEQLEEGARGVYSGVIGMFSLTGAVDLSIVIRTMVLQDGRITIGTGGAVTALSDPREEHEETLTKARALLDVIGQELAGR